MTVWGIVVGWAITVWVISSVLSRIGEAIGHARDQMGR